MDSPFIYLPPQDDPVTNLNNAFEVAEKYLDIPKMLDAEGECLLWVQSTPRSLEPHLSGHRENLRELAGRARAGYRAPELARCTQSGRKGGEGSAYRKGQVFGSTDCLDSQRGPGRLKRPAPGFL